MSGPTVPDVSSSRDPRERIREHREALEALAESDLPVSRWARELLALLDDEGGDGGER